MNKYYSYPHIDLWQTENWAHKKAPLHHLIEYITAIDTIEETGYVPSYDASDPFRSPLYRIKTHGIDDPAILADLQAHGIHYLCTGQGGTGPNEHCWFCLCPETALEKWERLPVLMVFDKEDESTPLWTGRAYTRYKRYADMLKESMDFILVVLVNQKPDLAGIYFGIMQEFSVLFPCDVSRFYLDVTKVLAKGKLRDVPGFTFRDEQGALTDPDARVEAFGSLSVPVLNIAGNWGNGDSLERGLIMTYAMNEGRFDREWLVHSETGRRMAQDMLYEYHYDRVDDPAFLREMEEKGLVYEIGHNEFGDRYITALPRQAVEEGRSLPLVIIFQEVYGGNEHLAVTAHSYLAEWLEIAAEGECGLLFFVLEDIVSNDRVIGVTEKVAEKYPIDRSRVYVTGHSHDGYFTYAFANRHPTFAAAVATMGMGVCPVGMNDVPDYTTTDNLAQYDLPLISLTGLCESGFPADEEDKLTRWVPMWKQVFRNMRIPEKTEERILAAFHSENYTERTTCLAGDRYETLWLDGFENYIVDFINVDGKSHLRVVRGQNMPHTVTPTMCTLAWSFLRRFRRDSETKEIIELY